MKRLQVDTSHAAFATHNKKRKAQGASSDRHLRFAASAAAAPVLDFAQPDTVMTEHGVNRYAWITYTHYSTLMPIKKPPTRKDAMQMPAYKNRDRGTYYASFYYIDWMGQKHKKKKEGFRTKREAQAYERSFLDEQAGAPTMTFASLYDLYKQDCALHLKQSTMASKFAMIEKHILPGFKALHVNAITPATVRAWQNEVLSKGYSPSYCYSLHRQLSAILNFACRYYGLQANPAARAGSSAAMRSIRLSGPSTTSAASR